MMAFPRNWEMVKINSVCEKIVDCINKTAPVVDYETPYKMIRTTNVKEGRVNLDITRFVTEQTFIKWNRRLTPQKNDIVLTREAPLGDIGLIRSNAQVMLGQRTMLYRANPIVLDQNFLYYSLLGGILQSQIRMLGSGSTVEHMRVPDAEKLIIPLPPTLTQKKIAAILTAYDDLIETNCRRIQLLENIAEEVYKEWFVRLRFPEYQSSIFIKKVPENWEQKRVKDAFDFLGGGTPSKSNNQYWSNADINWFTPTDITARKGAFLSESSLKCNEKGIKGSSAKIFPAYSLMMTSRATIGEIAINKVVASTNQGFITCLPNNEFPLSFLYFWLKLNKEYFLTLCGGSTFPELSKNHFSKISIIKPPANIMKLYTEKTDPLFQQLDSLLEANQNLAQTRDTLLPRLISGKLSVENIDINFPPSMEKSLA